MANPVCSVCGEFAVTEAGGLCGNCVGKPAAAKSRDKKKGGAKDESAKSN